MNKDGIFYDRTAGTYNVFCGGRFVCWAITRWGAEAKYKNAADQSSDSEIPMDGSYPSNDSITGPQDIGLVAGVDY